MRELSRYTLLYYYALRTMQILLIVLVSFSLYASNYRISGQINLPEGWSPVIYLSAINALDERNTASDEFIINSSEIDSDGNFLIEGNNIPAGERIYRLHLCKIGDPPSTIVIGGSEENHIHFILAAERLIQANSAPNETLFTGFTFNDPVNKSLQNFRHMVGFWQSNHKVNTSVSREYNKLQLHQFLTSYIDSCSGSLLKIIAAKELGLENLYHNDPSYLNQLKNILIDLDPRSPYVEDFIDSVAFLEYQNSSSFFSSKFFFIILLIAVPSLALWIRKIKFKTDKAFQNKMESLSIQERKVFEKLNEGLSNKEISAQLHIGLSTVKSHLYNIYSKLEINSRREALKYKNKV